MHFIIRTQIICSYFIIMGFAGFARDGFSPDHAHPVISLFHAREIRKLDSYLTGPLSVIPIGSSVIPETGADNSSQAHICSCQVLNLGSSNYDHRYMVLLAEKTNDGTPAAYEVAKSRLEKERKHLKKFFYDKVNVVNEIQGTGSCRAMFSQLSKSDKNLKLYEILNADIF